MYSLDFWPTVEGRGNSWTDFNKVFDTGWAKPRVAAFNAACDVAETREHFIVTVDLPGFKPAEIDIEATGREVIVSGERKPARKEEGDFKVHHAERRFGSFRRVFTLPEGFHSTEVTAHFEDGVLTLTLPKPESAKPVKIKIEN